MAWLRRINRVAIGIARAIFGVPARIWSVVRWLVILGAVVASFNLEVQRFVSAHPWESALGLLAYGALLYSYDLQVRLEHANWARLIEVKAKATFKPEQERAGVGGKRMYRNVLSIHFRYALRNPRDSIAHPYPRMRLLHRRSAFVRWREIDLESIHQAVQRMQGVTWQPDLKTHLLPGREMEVPGRQTTDLGGYWMVTLRDATPVAERSLWLDLEVDVIGQEAMRARVPIEIEAT